MSLQEIRRFQGVPDDSILIGTKEEQYKQIGNSVPWSLSTACGKVFRNAWLKSRKFVHELSEDEDDSSMAARKNTSPLSNLTELRASVPPTLDPALRLPETPKKEHRHMRIKLPVTVLNEVINGLNDTGLPSPPVSQHSIFEASSLRSSSKRRFRDVEGDGTVKRQKLVFSSFKVSKASKTADSPLQQGGGTVQMMPSR